MKKVVSKKNTNEIDVSELTPDMIIIVDSGGDLYKLSRVGMNYVELKNAKYAFISLNNSTHYMNGFFDSFSESFELTCPRYRFYVLDDIREISEIPRD